MTGFTLEEVLAASGGELASLGARTSFDGVTTDSRAAAYIAKHGRVSWEVDALPPEVLNKIVRRALRGVGLEARQRVPRFAVIRRAPDPPRELAPLDPPGHEARAFRRSARRCCWWPGTACRPHTRTTRRWCRSPSRTF